MSITTKAAQALQSGRLSDDKVKGLTLRKRPGEKSSRIWYVRYVAIGGKRQELRLGEFPAIGVADARKLASEVLVRVGRGEDPQAFKQARRDSMTVEELFDRVFEEHWALHTKESTQAAVLTNWRLWIKPELGPKKVEALTRSDLTRWHSKVGATRKRGKKKAKGGQKGSANRALAYLSKALSMAVQWGIIEQNPAMGIKKFPEKKMERFLSDEEYARLLRALPEAADRYQQTHIAILAMILFTGMRKGEVLGLRWTDVHLDVNELRLEETKTGRRTIVLSPNAAAILQTAKAWAENQGIESPWVFPQQRDHSKHVYDVTDTWKRLRAELDLKDVRIHDLRHSFASAAIRAGVGIAVVQQLLGHRHIATTQRYAHIDADTQRGATALVGSRLAALGEAPGDEAPSG